MCLFGALFFLFFESSVTHNQACDELFRINHSFIILQKLNALAGVFVFFFLNSREVLSLFSTLKMLKQM